MIMKLLYIIVLIIIGSLIEQNVYAMTSSKYIIDHQTIVNLGYTSQATITATIQQNVVKDSGQILYNYSLIFQEKFKSGKIKRQFEYLTDGFKSTSYYQKTNNKRHNYFDLFICINSHVNSNYLFHWNGRRFILVYHTGGYLSAQLVTGNNGNRYILEKYSIHDFLEHSNLGRGYYVWNYSYVCRRLNLDNNDKIQKINHATSIMCNSISFSPNGQLLAIGFPDNSCKIVRYNNNRISEMIKSVQLPLKHNTPYVVHGIGQLSINSSNTSIAFSGPNIGTYLSDFKSNKSLICLTPPKKYNWINLMHGLNFSHINPLYLNYGSIISNISNGKKIIKFHTIDYSESDPVKPLIAIAISNELELFNYQNKKTLISMKIPNMMMSPLYMVFSPKGNKIACLSGYNIWIYKTVGLKLIKHLVLSCLPSTLPIWSPSGNDLILVVNNHIQIYNPTTMMLINQNYLPFDTTSAMCISRNGNSLIIAYDYDIYIYNFPKLKLIKKYRMQNGQIKQIK